MWGAGLGMHGFGTMLLDCFFRKHLTRDGLFYWLIAHKVLTQELREIWVTGLHDISFHFASENSMGE